MSDLKSGIQCWVVCFFEEAHIKLFCYSCEAADERSPGAERTHRTVSCPAT